MKPLLSVRDLQVDFLTRRGKVSVLRGVSFDLEEKDILGLVGETGAGKSVTAFSILGLLSPEAELVGGEILLDDRNLLELSESEKQAIRGCQVAMVFQRFREALNPVFSIGSQLATILRERQGLSDRAARSEALDVLGRVGIADPKTVMDMYPHQLSGGMCQRVVIALALVCKPAILIADEPATGLDVVLQARILALFKELLSETGASAILITHDLAVVAETCDKVAVMCRGQVVEHGDVDDVLGKPFHPYTQGLVESVKLAHRGKDVPTIPGDPASIFDEIRGCSFHPRCGQAMDHCLAAEPLAIDVDDRVVRCHLYG